ncbi:MAG: hypothetical protein HY841_02990 [Bacteroidetes bacterium]|nr:hypothetical protein [Bacteroidota bacterium]
MRYIIIAGFLLNSFYTHSQQSIIATHTLFVEGFGAGVSYYSINYDKILFVTDKSVYSIRIGASALYNQVDTNKKGLGMTFPLAFNRWNTANKKHHFEVSVGGTISWGYYGDGTKVVRGVQWIITGFVGYRYQKPEGGLMIRAGWTPLYVIKDDWFIPYFAGAGLGYTF